jgi:clan AA aspartic protease (TIGR02281 family)
MSSLCRARHWFVVLAMSLLVPGSATAIYKWVDAEGKMHFAQDVHQVPEAYRAQAEANNAKSAGPSRVQTYSPPASMTKPSSRRASRPSGAAKGTFRIPVTQVGTSMRVQVRINDTVTAPFIVDTGASDVAIPRWVVEAAGIDLTGARTGRYSTANGIIEVPLLTLDSVELGGARVENVAAAVSDTMQTGLLGLSYFNHFQYSIDPAAGIVTLVANGLEESGRIRGGRSKPQWRSEFAQLVARRTDIERRIEDGVPSHSRSRRKLEAELAEFERQYRILEGEADDSKVPFSWRD